MSQSTEYSAAAVRVLACAPEHVDLTLRAPHVTCLTARGTTTGVV
jgi:hypothetical protein